MLDTLTAIGMSILSTLGVIDDSIIHDNTTCVGKVSTEIAVNGFGKKISSLLVDLSKPKQNYTVTLSDKAKGWELYTNGALFPDSFSIKNQYGFTVMDSRDCKNPFAMYIVYPHHLYSCSLELDQNETIIIEKTRMADSKKFVGQCPEQSLFLQKSVDK